MGGPKSALRLPPVLDPVGAEETREAAENAIARTEMSEKRMIDTRTSLIRIRADDGYLTVHGLAVHGYDGEELIDLS